MLVKSHFDVLLVIWMITISGRKKTSSNTTTGSNEFEFVDTVVTSAVYNNGSSSTVDKLVGQSIITNLDLPYAKIVDMDVACQSHSTIYGMKFGIKWNKESSSDNYTDIALYGNWTPNVISLYLWSAVKCGMNKINTGDNKFSCLSTTVITGIHWSNIGDSEILRQLYDTVGDGNLAVRITVYFYERLGAETTLGSVVGVIGVPSYMDTLNVPGSRTMVTTNYSPIGLDLKNCIQPKDPWVNTAPFEVDYEMGEVHIDLSNSLSRDGHNRLFNIGNLQLGFIRKNEFDDNQCVYLLGDSYIPYDSDLDFAITSGIYSIKTNSDILIQEITTSSLVLVQVVDGKAGNPGIHKTCQSDVINEDLPRAVILLQELTLFVRPKDYYVDRLDRITKPSSTMTFYVTEYGKPAKNTVVHLSSYNHYELEDPLRTKQPVLPENGIAPTYWNGTTNNDGLISFKLELKAIIPLEREYKDHECAECGSTPCPTPVCTLPIDGQVYYFKFCAKHFTDDACHDPPIKIALLAFSDYTYTSPPTWVNHVEPIFSMYARLAPVMKKILDMSNYDDVTKPHNIELLKRTFDLDFYDPSYMPTMRDLSPIKWYMIIEWLEDPLYNYYNNHIPPKSNFPQCVPLAFSQNLHLNPRCTDIINLEEHPSIKIPYYKEIMDMKGSIQSSVSDIVNRRPLFGTTLETAYTQNIQSACSKKGLKDQLQTALELEWSTIPLYLTSLYSIIPGCNTEIYELIRQIVMQEMLHFTLSANMLIALNGSPKIDAAAFTPTYPSALPGSVLPGLTVSLKKLSLSHIFETFMAIEVPQETEVAGNIYNDLFSIGTFYDEIKECIVSLQAEQYPGEDIFDASTTEQQVSWSGWDNASDVGELQSIVNTNSALKAINTIISQGEGSSPINPTDADQNKLAHFFRFEELVCQRHLILLGKEHYTYMGQKIEFNPSGVVPMRDHPQASTLIPNTRCYTEAKFFHNLYRKFLRKLDKVFNGKPSEIFTSIELMESLLIHAKRLMFIKYNPNDPEDDTTCGPAWDYDWPL